MKVTLLTLAVFGVTPVHAAIQIGGGVQPAKTIEYADGMTLADALTDARSLACSKVYVVRKGGWLEVDIPSFLRNLEDGFALKDGDFISGPEHVIGCIDWFEARAILDCVVDYRKIKSKSIDKPIDWDKRLDALKTHIKKTEPNKAVEPTPVSVTIPAAQEVVPLTSVAHLSR